MTAEKTFYIKGNSGISNTHAKTASEKFTEILIDFLDAKNPQKVPVHFEIVKRSSDLRTSNFKFEVVFVFQPFDIWIQASLIRHRWFSLVLPWKWSAVSCYFSSALRDDFFVLCWPSIQATPTACLLSPPLPYLTYIPPRRSITLPCATGACCILMQTIKVTNLGGPDTEQTSMDGNTARHGRHGLTSWLIVLLIDCLLACGVHAVTFTSPHSADIKRKLLKHKYINKVRILSKL